MTVMRQTLDKYSATPQEEHVQSQQVVKATGLEARKSLGMEPFSENLLSAFNLGTRGNKKLTHRAGPDLVCAVKYWTS